MALKKLSFKETLSASFRNLRAKICTRFNLDLNGLQLGIPIVYK